MKNIWYNLAEKWVILEENNDETEEKDDIAVHGLCALPNAFGLRQ